MPRVERSRELAELAPRDLFRRSEEGRHRVEVVDVGVEVGANRAHAIVGGTLELELDARRLEALHGAERDEDADDRERGPPP